MHSAGDVRAMTSGFTTQELLTIERFTIAPKLAETATT
jgi:hypothetical protein